MCRPDTLDPALLRPGRLDRKVEFGLPDLESRTQIFKIHTRTMNIERDIRFELLARLCPNSTGSISTLPTQDKYFIVCWLPHELFWGTVDVHEVYYQLSEYCLEGLACAHFHESWT
jgi:hypothetical protein